MTDVIDSLERHILDPTAFITQQLHRMSIDRNNYTAKAVEDIYNLPFVFTANITNQDTPTYREATTGKYDGEFDEAMNIKIEMLKRLNTWKVVRRKDVPK